MRVTPDCDSINSICISDYSGIQKQPDITFSGENYFTVWNDNRDGSDRVYGARTTTAGVALDPIGIPIGPSTSTDQYSPVIEFDGSRFLVVWDYSDALTGRFVDINGVPQDTVRIVSAPLTYTPNIAFDGVNYFVVWLGYTGSTCAVSGQFVSTTGTLVGDTILIGTATTYISSKPGISFDGTNYTITWSSPDDDNVWARIYDTSGVPSGPAFPVSTHSDIQRDPDVTSGTGYYFFTWSQLDGTNYDIYGNLDFIVDVKESNTYNPEFCCLKTSLIKDYLQIENSKNRKITIFDIYGRRIGSTLNGRFDCRNLASGIYFAEVSSVKRFKFVKIK